MITNRKAVGRTRRKKRVRKKVFGEPERPRLSIFRSIGHIYAQIIDDVAGKTLVAVSSLSEGLRGKLKGGNIEGAAQVGALLAEKAKAAKVSAVSFDRNGYRYHGRVKALADAARKGGLSF